MHAPIECVNLLLFSDELVRFVIMTIIVIIINYSSIKGVIFNSNW